MPLLVNGNDALYRNQWLQDLTCLGDVLKQAGYTQMFMGGASSSFGGKGEFYQQHGYQHVLGFEELSREMPDPNYRTGWGLYDDTLFELALRKFEMFANQRTPFNLTVLTLDTHHPKGQASTSCPPYPHSKNTMLQAVHCTDVLFGKFLAELKQHPAYKNTIVFAMSDHLAMRNVAQELYPPDRKLFAFALNTGHAGIVDMAGSHVDLPQTLLELLAIQTTATFPFGQSLLQQEDSERLALFHAKKDNVLKDFITLSDQIYYKSNICDREGIVLERVDQYAIRLGGRRFMMSNKGFVEYPDNDILVIKTSITGQFEQMEMLTSEETGSLIQKDSDALYFLLTHKASIPVGSFLQESTDMWKWYFGHPSSSQEITGTAEHLEDITISPQQCRDMTKRIRLANQTIAAEHTAMSRLHKKTQLPLIAHAGGGINSNTYTNSLEALNYNIQKGYILFEIDLSLTSDNIPVCIHDWNGQYQRWFNEKPPATPPTLQEFLTLKKKASYDLCTAETLIEWLTAHPQAMLVTDSKDDNLQILGYFKDHFPEFATRVIPQIYQPEEYAPVKAMGFQHIIWTLYNYEGSNDDVVSLAKKMSLFAITSSTKRITSKLISALKKLSIPIYVHTINTIEDVKKYQSLGIDGFYTDTLTNEILKDL